MNIITKIRKVSVYIFVCISQNQDAETLHIRVPYTIFLGVLDFKMLRTVQFNHDFCFRDIKVRDVTTNHLLPVDSHRQVSKETVPKLLFFRGHSFSKCFRESGQRGVVSFVMAGHFGKLTPIASDTVFLTSSTATAVPLPLIGEGINAAKSERDLPSRSRRFQIRRATRCRTGDELTLSRSGYYLPLRGEGGPLAVDEVRDSPERPIIEDSHPFQGANY